MALKRKASAFEEDNYTHHQHQQHSSPRSSTPSDALTSSPSSTTTNTSSPSTSTNRTLHNDSSFPSFPRLEPIPFTTLRTRKRHRDSRPSAQRIHEQTLHKLYEAQRLHLDDAAPLIEYETEESMDGDMSRDEEMIDEDVSMDVDVEIPRDIEVKQRSLDSFFGGTSTGLGNAVGR